MKKAPHITRFVDDDERELVALMERDDYVPGSNVLTPDRLRELQSAAGATINGERSKISLRVPRGDLSRLKSRALQEGIPYQTLINALIHKYVST